ncbi:hypothetical protein [Deinococcus cellulosilyticus]|uniref:Uncharacterized protein n=1 Tax=Deinococcus cellulosilyticus (strain DSM 18568 / NBRC 106333 / KACC 11606 / 5516J-15) TaxID=1223518 RepID=A0A511N6V3_DEIC1|nr:hypothetical protein [Deinococcus cellulosilyticus]GEM48207.1 hypothetical protein DC3_38420 [Deinococcus cellulosilyticus NBRC 106333 = KACC 11606]
MNLTPRKAASRTPAVVWVAFVLLMLGGFYALWVPQPGNKDRAEAAQLESFGMKVYQAIAVAESQKVSLTGLSSCFDARLIKAGAPPALPDQMKSCTLTPRASGFHLVVTSGSGRTFEAEY